LLEVAAGLGQGAASLGPLDCWVLWAGYLLVGVYLFLHQELEECIVQCLWVLILGCKSLAWNTLYEWMLLCLNSIRVVLGAVMKWFKLGLMREISMP
jgi:hypothetical protein